MKDFFIRKFQIGNKIYHLNFLRLALVLLILIALITVIVLAVNISKNRAKKVQEAELARQKAAEEQKQLEEAELKKKQEEEAAAKEAALAAQQKAEAEAEAQAKANIEPRAIVIDAGHGGKDNGASVGDILEKEINLKVAKLVQQQLEERGYTVIMTRTDDTYSEQEDRCAAANEAKVDVFVSVHQNIMSSDPSVHGIETWYKADSELGKLLARCVQENMILETDMNDRGIHSERELIVTTKTTMPAVVIEGGFLSNEADREVLVTDAYQQKLADGIVNGIIQFLEEADLPNSQYDFNAAS